MKHHPAVLKCPFRSPRHLFTYDPVLNPELIIGVRRFVKNVAELSIKLTRAETRQNELATLYKKIRSSLDNANEVETIPVIANDPALKSIRDQILRVEQNIMEQSKKYGPKHPVMVRVNSELKILQTKYEQEIQRIIKTIKNEAPTKRLNTSKYFAFFITK